MAKNKKIKIGIIELWVDVNDIATHKRVEDTLNDLNNCEFVKSENILVNSFISPMPKCKHIDKYGLLSVVTQEDKIDVGEKDEFLYCIQCGEKGNLKELGGNVDY